MAKGTIILPVQSMKTVGAFITAGARIDGGAPIWTVLFSGTLTESGLWQFPMPENFASALELKLIFSMVSATSGKVDLEADMMAVSEGDSQDLDTASFDSINEIVGGTTVPATAGYRKLATIPMTNADSVAPGDGVILRLHRDHDDTDDDISTDLELRWAWLEYTTT